MRSWQIQFHFILMCSAPTSECSICKVKTHVTFEKGPKPFGPPISPLDTFGKLPRPPPCLAGEMPSISVCLQQV